MQISKHLSLAEVSRSETAKRRGINNTPSGEHLENFKMLAENVFEKIREHFGVPIHISSGYRSKELNKAIGGSATSQHCSGEAIDIDMDGSANGITNAQVFNFIKDNLQFDQLIAEFPINGNPQWVHVSYASNGKQRNEILVAKKNKSVNTYIYYKSIKDLF
jgi:zinc D-Ala-D-Ala carboxypeptidase